MAPEKTNGLWLLATGVLILIIVISSCVIWVRHTNGRPLIISQPVAEPISGEIYIDGGVANPGVYPLKTGDSIDSLIQASGGLSSDADLSHIRLYVPLPSSDVSAQRIDINRAEAWLLQALPGIGEVRAQAIIDYRQQNGLFNNIEDLTKVPGITGAVFEKVKPYLTAGE